MTVNKVILVGNLGADPEIRYTANGDAIVTLSIATSETFKDKEGNKKTNTEWHRVILFGQLAEIAGKWLKKGSSVYLEGKLKTRKWQDQQGNDKYTTEIIGDTLRMLGNKNESSSSSSNNDYDYERSSSSNNSNASSASINSNSSSSNNSQYSREPVSAPKTAPDNAMNTPAFDDDDIPF